MGHQRLAQSLLENASTPDYLSLAYTHYFHADAADYCAQYDLALYHAKRAVDVLQDVDFTIHMDQYIVLARVHQIYGDALVAAERYEDALPVLDRSIELFNKLPNPSEVYPVAAIEAKAHCLRHKEGCFQEALSLLEGCLATFKSIMANSARKFPYKYIYGNF